MMASMGDGDDVLCGQHQTLLTLHAGRFSRFITARSVGVAVEMHVPHAASQSFGKQAKKHPSLRLVTNNFLSILLMRTLFALS
jgi:hypothetical protein